MQPEIFELNKEKVVSARFSTLEYNQLFEIANNNGQDMSEFARNAMRRYAAYLKRQKKQEQERAAS